MKAEDPKHPSLPEPAKPQLAGWQLERIRAGLADMHAGRVHPADEVFAEIAAKYGWAVRRNRTP